MVRCGRGGRTLSHRRKPVGKQHGAPTKEGLREPFICDPTGRDGAGEIEYVFGALEQYPGSRPTDRTLSDAMTTYWTNFARAGNLNGSGLPDWPRYDETGKGLLHLDETICTSSDAHRGRFEALDALVENQRK